MHQILLPDQLAARAKVLGWPLGRLAELAGIHRTTFTRAAGGDTSIRLSTLQRLTDTLVEREIALRDHLLALHPLEGGPGAAPVPTPGPSPRGGGEQEQREAAA